MYDTIIWYHTIKYYVVVMLFLHGSASSERRGEIREGTAVAIRG